MLNFKGIDYTTEWLEYPEIANKLQKCGIEANEVDMAQSKYTQYWCPALRLPNGHHIMNSIDIATELEKLFPNPPLFISDSITKATQEIIDAANHALAPAYLHRLADHLSPVSKAWYHQARGRMFGVDDAYGIARLRPWSGETPWQNAQPHLERLAKLLKEVQSGPFIRGTTISYADFIIGGYWEALKLFDSNGDVFGRVMKIDPSFSRHEEALRPIFERRSY